MLANIAPSTPKVGSFGSTIQKPATFRHELVNFIASELPLWRSRGDRPSVRAETALTAQLCAHLNGRARHSPGWDSLQFRTEVPDEQRSGRSIDLAPSPSGVTIQIEGRIHTEFDMVMPIECKRLPTPAGAKRDEREYVICGHSSVGGIQRFKAGYHGANHQFGAMIGYVQQETAEHWRDRIASWITALAGTEPGWSKGDLLQDYQYDVSRQFAVLASSHTRDSGLSNIELRHLWIEMN